MAQLTLQVVGAAGGKAKLSDFLLDDMFQKARENLSKPSVAEQSAQVIGAMTGSRKIVHIGKKKRHG